MVGRLRSAITLAIVKVLPDPVTPNSVWWAKPFSKPASKRRIASGWSPSGLNVEWTWTFYSWINTLLKCICLLVGLHRFKYRIIRHWVWKSCQILPLTKWFAHIHQRLKSHDTGYKSSFKPSMHRFVHSLSVVCDEMGQLKTTNYICFTIFTWWWHLSPRHRAN